MTVLGYWVLVVALCSTGASAVLYYRATTNGPAALVLPRRLLTLAVLSLVAASVLLLTLILRHDFTNGYVFSYSDRSLPLHYLISTFYAGQEGSFLFWALCAAVIALVLRRSAGRRGLEPWVMTAYMAVLAMSVVLIVAKSPFRSFHEMFPEAPADITPSDGRGLNPLLQNFWMVIHPPVLFIGFAAMAAPFALALGGLWKKEYDVLPRLGFPWVLMGTGVLGLGIMLGAYWAYGVLGWGGYWGWDPVENSSLVPWITGIALLHTMLAQLRTGKYVRTGFALAIVSFLLVIYSTFLTRSGVLGDASVHSFTDPGAAVYWLLLAYLALILVAGAAALVKRWRDLIPAAADTMLLSRETSLAAGSLALILSAAVILFGTSLPIFSTTRVEPSFYDTTHLPVAIAIGLLIGFSLFTQWEMQDGRETLKRSARALVLALVVAVILYAVGVQNVLVLLFIFAALFALFVNVEVAVKVARGDWRFLGGKITHMGIALFLLGVISVGKFSTMERIQLPLKTPVEAIGHRFTFTGYTQRADGKVEFAVAAEQGGKTVQLAPVMFEAGQQGLMRNPDIQQGLTRDLYLSPVQYDGPEENGGHETYTLAKGQSVPIGNVQATFVGFDMSQHDRASMGGGGGMAVGSIVDLASGADRERITPVALYRQGQPPEPAPVVSRLMNAEVVLLSMNVGTGEKPSTVTLGVHRAGTTAAGVLTVEASVKPLINLLWAGTLVMMIGFVLSIVKRSKEE